jgi:tRNA(Ile)-lysidine synthase
MKKAGSVHLDLPYGLVAERYYDILHLFRYSYSEGEGSSEDSGTDQKKDDLFMSRIIEIPEGHADEFIRSAPRGPYTKWIDYDKIRTELSFRHRQPGDRIAIDSECHTKSLSKLLTDEHIPPLSRDKLCLFADGNEIIWAVGLRMSERYKISEDTVRILEINFLHGKRN